MQQLLLNKIKSYLEKGKNVEFSISVVTKGVEIHLEKNNFLDDYDFFKENFGTWWYEGLCEMLISNDAYCDSADVQFELKRATLFANVSSFYDDAYFLADYPRHNKYEIITPLLVSKLTDHTGLNESTFDEELVAFDIDYDGTFNNFEIFYNDKKLILSASDIKTLENEVSLIIQDWSGHFWGKNELELEVRITLNSYDEEFSCEDTVYYKFEIEPIE